MVPSRIGIDIDAISWVMVLKCIGTYCVILFFVGFWFFVYAGVLFSRCICLSDGRSMDRVKERRRWVVLICSSFFVVSYLRSEQSEGSLPLKTQK